MAHLTLFSAFLFRLHTLHPNTTKILFGPIICKMLVLLSLIPISFGYYIYELGINGQTQVHAGYFVCLSVLLLLTGCKTNAWLKLAQVETATSIPTNLAKPIYLAFSLAIVLGSILFLWSLGLSSGFAILQQTDRFEFRAGQGWLFSVIITFKPIFAGILGMVRFKDIHTKPTKLLLDLSLYAFVVMTMLFGEKFLSIIITVGYYYLPYFIVQKKRPKLSAGLLALGLIIGVAVTSATWNVYSDYGRLDSASTLQRLLYRFTGQGELWYISTAKGNSLVNIDESQSGKLVDVLLARNANQAAFNSRVGIFYLVEKFGERGIADQLLSSVGLVQFTGGFESYFLMIWGHVPMISMVFFAGLLLGCAAYYWETSARDGAMFSVFAGTYFLSQLTSATNQGSIWQIVGLVAVVYMIILLVVTTALKLFLSTSPPADELVLM